ncbi:hypothetical protein MTO96_047589 [Rhipicephalus appendiculatus]
MADFDNSSVMSLQRSYNVARVVWTNDLIEELISEVRHYRYLYDLMHPDYKNPRKKDDTWESVGKKLGLSVFLTAVRCQPEETAAHRGPACTP